MTDLERFIYFYKSVGIDPPIEEWMNKHDAFDLPRDTLHYKVRLAEGESPQFIGYGCFFSEVIFDKDGKFLKQGFWE